jgi:hypothetical protein
MPERNWDAELAKIDKQINSMSDDDLVRGPAPVAPAVASARGGVQAGGQPAMAAKALPAGSDRRTLIGVVIRVGLALGLAVGLPLWPYGTHCGSPLFGYLAAVVVALAAGTWAAMSTWRARMARTHVAALGITAWIAVLAAREVLPRVGYATDAQRTQWICK